jgi:arginase
MAIGLLSAPSNLGLRPPAPTSVPGCAKAPEALREAGLHRRLAELGARERGVVLPGRYADDAAPGSLRNQAAIIEHARRLAARIDLLRAGGLAPLVLGGDCSILVAAGLSLRRTGPLRAGRSRRAHRLPQSGQLRPVREPGRGGSGRRRGPALARDRRHRRAEPLLSPVDTAHAGCRDDDEQFGEATALLGAVLPASQIRHRGAARAARTILDVVGRADLDGYWIHLDADILDPSVMPAVDSPDPGGLGAAELTELLAALAPRGRRAGDRLRPDLDPDGGHASHLTDILVTGLAPLSRDRR